MSDLYLSFVERWFAEQPAAVRRHFDNDPLKFIEWLNRSVEREVRVGNAR